MAYSADSFVADEVPTTAKWNKLWTNDAAFNDGTGIATGAITSAKISGIDKSLTTTDSNPYKFSVYRAAAWTTANNAFGKVTFDTETFDTNNNFASGTYTVPVAGFYALFAAVAEVSSSASAIPITSIYKNSSEHKRGAEFAAGETANVTMPVASLVNASVSDTLEIYFRGNNLSGSASIFQTYFNGFLVSRT